jgi:hypothetical protein
MENSPRTAMAILRLLRMGVSSPFELAQTSFMPLLYFILRKTPFAETANDLG